MEDAGGGHVQIDDLGQLALNDRQEQLLDRHAQIKIPHRWTSNDGRNVNWIAPMRYRLQVKHGVLIRQRIESGMIAERPFQASLAGLDISLKHDLAFGGNLQI